MNLTPIKLIECPRDAMQGIQEFIPTSVKVAYINQLLKVGFDTIDFGSFVSPRAIPQMRDTAEVLSKLELSGSRSKLLVIVANKKGADIAAQFGEIGYLGFPLSISETFQQRNTNKTIVEALNVLNEIQQLCIKNGKKLVAYLSMGFGNPYGDPFDVDMVAKFTDLLTTMGISIISLADTIGVANKETITYLYEGLIKAYPQVEFGAHLHSTPNTSMDKIKYAYQAGCRRFDGAIRGFGGCPMAKDDLTGNIATEVIASYLYDHNEESGLDQLELDNAILASGKVFDHYH